MLPQVTVGSCAGRAGLCRAPVTVRNVRHCPHPGSAPQAITDRAPEGRREIAFGRLTRRFAFACSPVASREGGRCMSCGAGLRAARSCAALVRAAATGLAAGASAEVRRDARRVRCATCLMVLAVSTLRIAGLPRTGQQHGVVYFACHLPGMAIPDRCSAGGHHLRDVFHGVADGIARRRPRRLRFDLRVPSERLHRVCAGPLYESRSVVCARSHSLPGRIQRVRMRHTVSQHHAWPESTKGLYLARSRWCRDPYPRSVELPTTDTDSPPARHCCAVVSAVS